MARLILGNHPRGASGLFISQPGVAVENTDPNDTSALVFSTQWASVLSIIAVGPCSLDPAVVLPNLGFRPFVRWEAQFGTGSGATYDAYQNFGTTQRVGTNDTRRYDYTRYMVKYDNDNTFRIVRRIPSIDNSATDANQLFRYVAFNLPVNA